MADKEYVSEVGKAAAVALRCSKPWHHSGRTIILDAGFAGLAAATGLARRGLYMIGNVKGGHSQFPKKWLLDHVPQRGMRVTATSSISLPGSDSWSLLAAADRDKQPMALLGTAGSSGMGATITRKFIVIRPDGTYEVRRAELQQLDIHAQYRASFNGVDKHNALRQGNHNFEASWRTHRWWVRDFQMLIAIAEVNAYLLWRHFQSDTGSMSFYDFRSRLTFQLLHHPILMREREQGVNLRAREVVIRHSLVQIRMSGARVKNRCRMCGNTTTWRCVCCADEKGIRMALCLPVNGSECFSKHAQGLKPESRRSRAQKARQEVARAARALVATPGA